MQSTIRIKPSLFVIAGFLAAVSVVLPRPVASTLEFKWKYQIPGEAFAIGRTVFDQYRQISVSSAAQLQQIGFIEYPEGFKPSAMEFVRDPGNLLALAMEYTESVAEDARPRPIDIWDLSTFELVASVSEKAHTARITKLYSSPENPDELASSSIDTSAKVWLVSAGEIQWKKTLDIDDERRVWSVAFSKDGRTLAVGYEDGQIIPWRVSDKKHHYSPYIGIESQPVLDLAFSRDGDFLAAASREGFVSIWRVWKQSPFSIGRRGSIGSEEPVSPVVGIAFSPAHNEILALGNQDGRVQVWNISDLARMYSLSFAAPVVNVGFSHSGDLIFGCTEDGQFKLWEASTGALLNKLVNRPVAFGCDVSFDGKLLAWALEDGISILAVLDIVPTKTASATWTETTVPSTATPTATATSSTSSTSTQMASMTPTPTQDPAGTSSGFVEGAKGDIRGQAIAAACGGLLLMGTFPIMVVWRMFREKIGPYESIKSTWNYVTSTIDKKVGIARRKAPEIDAARENGNSIRKQIEHPESGEPGRGDSD
jgi:hypothetical protein